MEVLAVATAQAKVARNNSGPLQIEGGVTATEIAAETGKVAETGHFSGRPPALRTQQ